MPRICKRGHTASTLPAGRTKFRQCKACKVEDNFNWQLANPVAYAARKARFYDNNPEYNRLYYKANYVRSLLQSAHTRAKKAGVPFALTENDIVIPTHCPWLGTPLAIGRGKLQDASPSLDRILPEKGYIPSNIIIVSYLANRIKTNGTLEQIEAVAAGLRATLETRGVLLPQSPG